MSLLGDILTDAGERFTMLGPLESEWLAQKCSGLKPAEDIPLHDAYTYIAGCRRADTLTATVADSEVAPAVHKFKGGVRSSETYTRSGFNRSIKPKLRKYGLLDYSDPRPTKGREGNETTCYRFPFIDEVRESGDAESMRKLIRESSHANEKQVSHAVEKVHKGNVTRVCEDRPVTFTTPCENPYTDFPNSRGKERREVRGIGMEEANKYKGDHPSHWVPLPDYQCPAPCLSEDIRVSGGTARCFTCGREKPLDDWYPF